MKYVQPVNNHIRNNLFKYLILIPLMGFLIFIPPFSNFIVSKTWAGTLTSADLTISDSRAGQDGIDYDFDFTVTVTTAIEWIQIEFCTSASGTCTAPTGFDASGATIDAENVAGTLAIDSQDANTLELDNSSAATQSTQAVTIDFDNVDNPTTENSTFYARITTYSADDGSAGTTVLDSATVAAATLEDDSITFTADVDPLFTFTLTGLASGVAVNGENTTASISSNPDNIDYGALTVDTPSVVGHNVAITTNAPIGYNVTAKALATPPLVDGSNNIDAFSGTNASPTTWSGPAGTSSSVNTGYFGYTTEDSSLCTGTASRFTSSGGNKWAGTSTTATEIICNTAVPSGGSESTEIAWQIEVNGVQPPGTYTGTVVLVATPTY